VHILYPIKNDPTVFPVHTSILECKKRFTFTYPECYFVLTPAEFLQISLGTVLVLVLLVVMLRVVVLRVAEAEVEESKEKGSTAFSVEALMAGLLSLGEECNVNGCFWW
jgi:hypothetical protein